MSICKEGFVFIGSFFAVSVGAYVMGHYVPLFYVLSVIAFILTVFSLFFFRNPDRKCPNDENIILSPGDGTVLEIATEENDYIGHDARVVRIFLSIFNVHVQRSPINGVIHSIRYRKGRFLPAMDCKAHSVNEQNIIDIEGKSGVKCQVIQIAGIIARRIVCWCAQNDHVKGGQTIGLIRFGSQVNIYIPSAVEIKVQKGQRVKGGVTTIGEIR